MDLLEKGESSCQNYAETKVSITFDLFFFFFLFLLKRIAHGRRVRGRQLIKILFKYKRIKIQRLSDGDGAERTPNLYADRVQSPKKKKKKNSSRPQSSSTVTTTLK